MNDRRMIRGTIFLAWCFLVMSRAVLAAAASNPCTFCTRGVISTPEKAVVVPGFDILSTCADLDSILPLVLTEDDDECGFLQDMSAYCGCPIREDACSLCSDGSPVTHPDLEVSWLAEEFSGIVPTCAMVEAYALSFADNDDVCKNALQLVSSYCGCPPIDNYCEYCSGQPLKEEYYDKALPFLKSNEFGTQDLGINSTCEWFYLTQYQLPQDHKFCKLVEEVTFHCGCNDGIHPYYGTSSKRQQAILVWLPRSVALISLLASIAVLVSIFRSKKNRESLYHQLVAVIVVFDIVTSLAWIVGPAAIDQYTDFGMDKGIYGTLASSNEKTCTAQGFFVQLGFTSVYMNVSLTVYYFLVVACGLREERLKKLRIWLFAPPLIIGFGLAFAVIPHVEAVYSVCQPLDQWVLLFLAAIPIWISTVAIFLMLLILYCKVRLQQQHTTEQWSWKALIWKSSSARNRQSPLQPRSKTVLEREVFFRCVSYALAFGITWPLLSYAQVRMINVGGLPYSFWVVLLSLTPMQGFNNALSYFRPIKRIMKRWQDRSDGEERQPEGNESSSQNSRFFRRFLESSFFLDSLESDEVDPVVELSNLKIVQEFEEGTIALSRNTDLRDQGRDDEGKKSLSSNSGPNDSAQHANPPTVSDQTRGTLADSSGDPTASNGVVSSAEEILVEAEVRHSNTGSFSLRKEQTIIPM